MAMRPYENVAGTPEKVGQSGGARYNQALNILMFCSQVFSWISSMSSSAYLQVCLRVARLMNYVSRLLC